MTDSAAAIKLDSARAPAAASDVSPDEIVAASRRTEDTVYQTDIAVPSIHCGGCIRKIEQALNALPGVISARVNLSLKRVSVRWRADKTVPPFMRTLKELGYEAHLSEDESADKDPTFGRLIRALAVAGFAAGNIMLLSVSVWAGAGNETRDLFHWISALIALPALAYSGRIFFASAARALRHGQTNMDVPISIGVLLAYGMSLYDTIHGRPHAYFEASVMLLFFLLAGRTLDHVMREKARNAVKGLSRLVSRTASVVDADGNRERMPVKDIAPGMTIQVAAGERVPVDGTVTDGISDLDCAVVSGESTPQPAASGTTVRAGVLNLTAPITIKAIAAADDSFLAEMMRLMQAAESGKSTYRRIADQAARLYAPLVHTAALASFAGWMFVANDWHQAVTIAVAVLIITCPCALGLAVPMVHVVAARRLFDDGIMAKDGTGLERMSDVDTVVFDKTGTLTLGQPVLSDPESIAPRDRALAAAMAAHSRHPYAEALAPARGNAAPTDQTFDTVSEHPGQGVEAVSGDHIFRLGRREWALGETGAGQEDDARPETVLSRNGECLAVFRFTDRIRPGSKETITALKSRGLAVHLISGDRAPAVAALAEELGIDQFEAAVAPAEKTAYLERLTAEGRKVLMVGDGLNDAPALAAAHASMAPANAADVGRQAADFVFLRDSLEAVPRALSVARAAQSLIRQNLGLAALYNAVALPVAVLGFVTPLIAAAAMSASSIVVVANALRLNGGGWRGGWFSSVTRAQPRPNTMPVGAARP